MDENVFEKPAIADGQWLKIAMVSIILTIVYNMVEAAFAVYFGYDADSIALIGFGYDSLLEVSAATFVLWRLMAQVKNKSEDSLENTEKLVHRFVGVTFFMLALYIVLDAFRLFAGQEPPQETVAGIIIALLSLIIMPVLSLWKIRAAKALNSNALLLEAKETIACAILSLILLFGLGLNAALGWWWADPVAALLMVPWLVKEGLAGIKNEPCCQ